MLLRFQRKHLVETTSDSQDSDEGGKLDTLKLMDSKNPLIRLSIFGRLKRIVETYKGEQLTSTDRSILRGIYKRHLKDFDEDLAEKEKNLTLFKRLKESFFSREQRFRARKKP